MSHLDLTRLSELREHEGMTPQAWGEMLRGLLESLTAQRHAIDAALDAGDLAAAARAAHSARNEALIVGAQQLNRGLGEVEQAARRQDAEGASEALRAIEDDYAATAAALAHAAGSRPEDV